MTDWEDSFAERMRNRALQRIQKNQHIMKTDSDTCVEPVQKKRNILLNKSEPQNKENISGIPENPPVRPVIAEHLTIRKSLNIDKMECDEPEVFIMRNTKKKVFAEENTNFEHKEDVYVKHCKNRLANLAGKFKQFEEDDRPSTTNNKQVSTMKRKSDGDTKKTESSQTFAKPGPTKKLAFDKPKPPENTLLDQTVINTLESQGYSRTESDAHLFYDFKKAKNAFNDGTKSNTPSRAPQLELKKTASKEISKLHSNSKYQSNVFVQNAKKTNDPVQDDDASTDPCLLSVAERRKLFEKRLFGAEKVEIVSPVNIPSNVKMHAVENDRNMENIDSENYSTCESECNSVSRTSDGDFASESEVPQTEDERSEDENKQSTTSESEYQYQSDNEPDVSAYPVLQTIQQVKVSSTPKPGCLYPSVSDLDGDADEDLNISKENKSLKATTSIDDSFERELLCATNHIISSYVNDQKSVNDTVNESKPNIVSKVKNAILPDEDLSFSLSSPGARSSLLSVECDNETASFTYFKNYSNRSANLSSIPASNPVKQIVDECDAKVEETIDQKEDELDVRKKIMFLEEQNAAEKVKLTQAIRALKFCQSSSFLNSVSHLEAEKLVLLSQLRIVAIQSEIDRMKVENSIQPQSNEVNSVRGNVIISKIKLPVKMPIVQTDLREDVYNNLMCVIKCGATVLATSVVSVMLNNVKHDTDGVYVEFPDAITVRDVYSDFKISVEVYNLVVEKKEEHAQGTKKEKKTPTKKSKKQNYQGRTIEDRKNAQSSFNMVGYMIFSQNEMQRHQWILNKQQYYHTPLVGMILMRLNCNLTKITVQKHGFLTMYEVISGYGAWSRNWFYLNGDKLSFWKYPEQETTQDPIGIFNLQKCITKVVTVVGYDVVFRPQTFLLQFDPPTYLTQFKGFNDNRLLLSADNEEERISWCECLCEVLKSIRSWSTVEESKAL